MRQVIFWKAVGDCQGCPSEQKETKDNKIQRHVWSKEINERSKVAHGFKMIFINCSGLHLVFSLFLYISSERERDMMRQFIKGQEGRLFPQLLLRVNECNKESLTVSPIRLGNSVRVRDAVVGRFGGGLEAGCFAYLSPSSRGLARVWSAAECASSRSLRSY